MMGMGPLTPASFARLAVQFSAPDGIADGDLRSSFSLVLCNPARFVGHKTLRILPGQTLLIRPPGLHPMRLMEPFPVIVAVVILVLHTVLPCGQARAALALIKVAVRHSCIFVEFTKRQRITAFATGFHGPTRGCYRRRLRPPAAPMPDQQNRADRPHRSPRLVRAVGR